MTEYDKIENTRIEEFTPIQTPDYVKGIFDTSQETESDILSSRMIISNIMNGSDKRKLLIIGPCSIHSPKATKEYAVKLKELHNKYIRRIYIVMRCYISKPRTTIGWKGIIHDPDLDNSCRIDKGILLTRKLLLDIVQLGLPIATEWLDPISPQYFSDLVSFGAIGARTAESPVHRELVSGLSHPVGFKNGISGDVSIAANAILVAKESHTFLGCISDGTLALVKTKGNNDTCCILRGGRVPNYTEDEVHKALHILFNKNVNSRLIIDCSHGNSGKDFRKQCGVCRDVVGQIQKGNSRIVGVMIESFLLEGRQDLGLDPSKLAYGQSITDSCIGFEETEELLEFIFINV